MHLKADVLNITQNKNLDHLYIHEGIQKNITSLMPIVKKSIEIEVNLDVNSP